MAAGDCTLPDTQTTLQELWQVISDRHSASQVDRQVILLDMFLSVTGDRVKVADLLLLSKVMAFFGTRPGRIHEQQLQKILDVLKRPPTLEKASDVLHFKHYIVELFTTLGCLLLQIKQEETQSQILDIVRIILMEKRENCASLVPKEVCIQAIEISEFVESLTDFITLNSNGLTGWALDTALRICLMSDFCCWTLLIKGAIESLLVRMTVSSIEERFVITRLLWRLLNCTKHREDWAKVTSPSRLALRSLRYILRKEALLHHHPGRPRKALYSVSALTLKIIHLFPDGDYVLSGLTEDIAFYATITEALLQIHVLPYFRMGIDHMHFKMLMLACLALSPVSKLSLIILRKYRVAECLITILKGATSYTNPYIIWTPQCTIDLFRCALPTVASLFDRLCQEFLKARLMETLMSFLKERYVDTKTLPDDLARLVVSTTASLCFHKAHEEVAQDAMRKAGAVVVLLDLCDIILQPKHSLTTDLQYILHRNLCVLTELMKNRHVILNTHGKKAFELVTSLYKRILTPSPNDSLLHNKLILAAGNFAWEVIVWNQNNISIFVDSGAMFSHMDILERSPFSVQLTYLSMLVDLCESHRSVPYLVSWRGREGVKLLSLLCRIWRGEEERLAVPRSRDGCVSNVERPLMGEQQFALSKSDKSYKPVSVCDVYGSSRPKIYAIVQLLQRHKDVAQICEEHYRLGHDQLSYEDRVTLELVKAYLPLKMGEIWWDIRNKQGKVVPLDRYLAETLADRYLDWSLCVQRAQHDILRKRDKESRAEESAFYSLVRGTQLTTALDALKDIIAIAHTADRQMLLRSHRQLREGIKASRVQGASADLRAAYPGDMNVLLVSSQADIVLQNEYDL